MRLWKEFSIESETFYTLSIETNPQNYQVIRLATGKIAAICNFLAVQE